jgi:hypothetical protein
MLQGMGPFLLVRVSAISVAWVHEQCARWSPEVWEDGSGDLVVSRMVPVISKTGASGSCRSTGTLHQQSRYRPHIDYHATPWQFLWAVIVGPMLHGCQPGMLSA